MGVQRFRGGNGNNYYGLFNAWARGLHLAASGNGDDEVIPDVAVSPFIGHPGEAYGLISDAYATPDGSWNFAFCTNGKWDGFSGGPASAFYAVEQDVFAALRERPPRLHRLPGGPRPDAGHPRARPAPRGRHHAPAGHSCRVDRQRDRPSHGAGRPGGRPPVGDRTVQACCNSTPRPLPGGWLVGRVQGPAGMPAARFLLVVGQ